ncbi:hypothetical protein Patl1_21556 [Pistacia atlantica]|uniref:Uncharacterized protein n=1 Tax=Pistacia atlantica TaxID=434234 RepID=A0ACC1BJ33_9ROSI|nr:hypothetical protein Patl1_21556 [Pistacia atlantica]
MANTDAKFILTISAIVLKGHWAKLLKPNIVSSLSSATIHQVLLNLSLFTHSPNSWAFFKWIETTVPNYKHSLQSSWIMIHLLTKHKHFKNAQHLLEKIAHRDFLSTPSVLNALVKVHDDPAGNSHVLSWLVIIYANMKMTEEAVHVFDQMRVHGLSPHLHACTVLLNSLAKDRLTDKVWKVYKKMVRLGVVANIHVYNVLLHACCKSGDVEKAEKLLSEMEFKCLDQYTYKALIHGFCKVQEMDSAKELLFGMLDAGFAPSYCTYCWLVDGYCKKCNDEAVIKLLDEFVGRGVCVDISVYRALIRRFCKIEKVDCAQRVFSLMQENGISGDSVIYTSLAYAYWRAGKANATLDIMDFLMDHGIILTSDKENVTVYYKALIHGFCKVQEMDSAKELLFGLLVPVFLVIGLIHGLLMVAATNAIKKH